MNDAKYIELVDLIRSFETRSRVEDFLQGILTPSELEQVVKRLQIIKKLKKGKPQRDIAEELEVGISTVTRGSRELNRGRFKYIK